MMVQRLFLIAGWLAFAFIVYATLSPIESRPAITGPQFEHFAAFALLGFSFALGYRGRTLFLVAVVIGSVCVLETLQLLTTDRHGRILDALVKSAGGICGIGAGRIVSLLLREPVNRLRRSLGIGRPDEMSIERENQRDLVRPK